MSKEHKFTVDELQESIEYLHRLKEKYEDIGQDFIDYLEGLVQSNGLTYWHYIGLNSLLGLQVPRTNHEDELIFIIYHQISELYFKLIKHEIIQLTDPEKQEYLDVEKWHLRLKRVVNYFRHVCNSFDLMYSGMDLEQFRQFRMALLPASGFQSVQFRHIEIMSTNLNSLLQKAHRDKRDIPLEKLYEHIYWKAGGIEMASGNKTLTLKEFEEKYDSELKQWIKTYQFRNINFLYFKSDKSIKEDEGVKHLLREYDTYINVHWRLSHLSASSRYLAKAEEGTGGTNWKRYLPPKFQKLFFFEALWSEEEKDDWGKAAMIKIFQNRIKDNWSKE